MNQRFIEAVKALQDGTDQSEKQEAFEIIYNEFSKSTYFLALKLMKNPQEAEDVTQDVFIKVFQRIGELKEPKTFPAWLKRIAVNHCTDTLKKNNTLAVTSTEETTAIEYIEETNHSLIPDKSLDNAETARLIVEIVDKLPLPQRVCVYYFYYEQMSVAEIAENLSVNENTVKSRLSLAREKIRKALKDLEDKEGIKLYSIAPFVIPALLRMMKDTQVPEHLFSKITADLGLSAGANSVFYVANATESTIQGASNIGFFGKLASLTLKTKILLVIAVVVVIGSITTGIIFGVNAGGGIDENNIPSVTTTESTTATAVTTTTTVTSSETTTPPVTTIVLETTSIESHTTVSPEITEPEITEPELQTQAHPAQTQPMATQAPQPEPQPPTNITNPDDAFIREVVNYANSKGYVLTEYEPLPWGSDHTMFLTTFENSSYRIYMNFVRDGNGDYYFMECNVAEIPSLEFVEKYFLSNIDDWDSSDFWKTFFNRYA